MQSTKAFRSDISNMIRSTKSKLEMDSLVGGLISDIGEIPSLPKEFQKELELGMEFAAYQIEEKKRRLTFLINLQLKYYPEDYERENGI